MHSLATTKPSGLVPETCAQAVASLVVSARKVTSLSTHARSSRFGKWKISPVFPLPLHKFVMHLYPRSSGTTTDRAARFSPLSTALIIRSMSKRKENLLIGQRG